MNEPFDFVDTAVLNAVSDVCRATPVLELGDLSGFTSGPVSLKLENLQVTGSFKVRGAAAKLASLSEDARTRGVVTCSSGNHGRAVAHVAARFGIPCTVYVPTWCDPVKVAAIEASGATLRVEGDTFDEAESLALGLAEDESLSYVSAFDDPAVIAGQGTIGAEILNQVPDVDTIVCPLSGGGLLGGISEAVKAARPSVEFVGVSAQSARVMYESIRAGHPIEMEETETVASALAGGIGQPNRYSFDIIQKNVDEHVLVSEAKIKAAMRYAVTELKLVVEGGGAVGLAAILAEMVQGRTGHTVVILSGGNVDSKTLSRVLP